MKLEIGQFSGVIIAAVLLAVNVIVFSGDTRMFAAVNVLIVVVALGSPVIGVYRTFRLRKRLEEALPHFMSAISDNLQVGMSLPKAVKEAAKSDYGSLNPYVRDIAAKLDWGISFENVLKDFAEKTDSDDIKRTIKGVIQAHRSGGKIGDVLKSMSTSVRELESLKKERESKIYSQAVSGYFIYIIFVGIMVAMTKILIPALTSQFAGFGNISEAYADTFRALVVIQGLFAGLGVGKMSEGTIVAGIKHAFVLSLIGYTVFILF